MSATTGSLASYTPLGPKAVWIIFKAMTDRFPNKFKETAKSPTAHDVWLADLRAAGITDAMVSMGLARSATLEWPPSVGEFIALCRPRPEDCGLPSLQAVVMEIFRAAHAGATWAEQQWSHAAVYYTAKGMTMAQLQHRDAEKLIENRYLQMIRRIQMGESMELPTQKALPMGVERRDPAVASAWLDKIYQTLGRTRPRKPE